MIKSYDYNDIEGRRDPQDSGAMAVVGLSWEKVITLLSNTLGEIAPEIRHKSTIWLLKAHPNGFRIEFFDDDDAFNKRLEANSILHPPVHAGRLNWM